MTKKSYVTFIPLLLITSLSWINLVFAEVEISGFVQGNYTGRITGMACSTIMSTACDFLLGEERLQLELDASTQDGSAAMVSKVDLFYDAVLGMADIDVREVYADLTSDWISVRIGRQIITWGVGDLLFINDTFPKDWIAFFTGRPLQYLKVGSDALKFDIHPEFITLEIVIVPFFQFDMIPSGKRLAVFNPFPSSLPQEIEDKPLTFGNTEFSAKISQYISDWELAAYFSRTFYRLPAMALDSPTTPTKVLLSFPRLNTYGASISGGFLGGVLNFEGAYYDSVHDRMGTNPSIANSEVKTLLGYSYMFWQDATVGIQGFMEWMQNYDSYKANIPSGFPTRDQVRLTATLRFTQLLFHQTLHLNLFVFWGINESDAYFIPSIRYDYTDALWVELGGNIFLAKRNSSQFGSINQNDNIYLIVRYSFLAQAL